jgi:hypothetical protein
LVRGLSFETLEPRRLRGVSAGDAPEEGRCVKSKQKALKRKADREDTKKVESGHNGKCVSKLARS